MPVLKGYQVQTHRLADDDREVDILHWVGDATHIFMPGQQLGVLSGEGWRSTGHCSTSDIAQSMDKHYVRREPDPHKIYSRSRTLHTALFDVVGLIQKTFHTKSVQYVSFCYEFIKLVLPAYRDFASYHAELIMAWYEALDHFDTVGRGMDESKFRAALQARNTRLNTRPDHKPLLVLGTMGCEQVVYYDGEFHLATAPLDSVEMAGYAVAQLREAHVQTERYRARYPKSPPIGLYLAMLRSDGTVALPDGTLVVCPREEQKTESPRAEAAGLTAEEISAIVRSILQEELPKALQTREDRVHQAAVIRLLTQLAEQNVESARVNREQLELSRQTVDLSQQAVDLVTPSHQLLLPASDYLEMDGVEEALKQAPRLAEPVLGLVHCPDHGTASLFMKLLCREEDKKIAANAVDRIMASEAGLEEPPLYIPKFRMECT